METKLYVGNLAYATTEAEVRQAFAQAGAVLAVKLIMDPDSGQSKGFAFVTMGTPADARAAISQWHGAKLAGRALTVNEAQNREKPPAAGVRAGTPAGTGYQSRFGAFGASGISPVSGAGRGRRTPAGTGYQSRYNAFGAQTDKPAQPRRRGGGGSRRP